MATPLLSDGFKAALSGWASGVCVVTTNANGMLYGLTVSSFTSLSLEPPLVLVCLNNQNRMPELIGEANGFAVSILGRHQESASRYFARSGRLPTPDFTEIEGEWTASGQPVVRGSIGWLACELHKTILEGDHTIVMGRVVETFADPEGEPLVYFRRGYRSIA